MQLNDSFADAIELLEQAGALEYRIKQVTKWPGLSGAQRAAAMVLVCLEHTENGGVPPRRIAEFLNIPMERAHRLFDGVEEPPFVLLTVGSGDAVYSAVQALEYGG